MYLSFCYLSTRPNLGNISLGLEPCALFPVVTHELTCNQAAMHTGFAWGKTSAGWCDPCCIILKIFFSTSTAQEKKTSRRGQGSHHHQPAGASPKFQDRIHRCSESCCAGHLTSFIFLPSKHLKLSKLLPLICGSHFKNTSSIYKHQLE